MRLRYFFIGILAALGLGVLAGTNTLSSVSGGVVRTSHVNQFYTAMNQTLAPRNSSGVVTDLGGPLGTSSYRWDDSFIKKITFGTASNGCFVDESGGVLRFGVGGSAVVSVNGTGFVGSGIVSTSNIANNAVTRAKLEALGHQTNSLSGTSTTTSTSFSTLATITITTTGRPVMLAVISNGDNPSYVGVSDSASTTAWGDFRFRRDSTVVGRYRTTYFGASGTLSFSHNPPWHIDTPGAGTYTYTFQMANVDGASTTEAQYLTLFAYEL